MNFALKLYRAKRHLKFNAHVLFWLYAHSRFANRCETFTWKILCDFLPKKQQTAFSLQLDYIVMFCSSRTPRVPPRTPGGPYGMHGNLRAGLNSAANTPANTPARLPRCKNRDTESGEYVADITNLYLLRKENQTVIHVQWKSLSLD